MVIYYGVNFEDFNPKNRGFIRKRIRDKYNIKENEALLLFVGKEYKRKGLEYIIKALRFLQRDDIKLLVVGEDKSLDGRRFISTSDEKIIFVRHSQDVAQYYVAADIFIFPITFDAFGMVLLEAMAAGLPVIVSKRAGASEIIENKVDGIILNNYKDSKEIEYIINNEDIKKR